MDVLAARTLWHTSLTLPIREPDKSAVDSNQYLWSKIVGPYTLDAWLLSCGYLSGWKYPVHTLSIGNVYLARPDSIALLPAITITTL